MGSGLYCGCADGCVRLFDVRSGKIASEDRVSNDAISGLRVSVSTPANGSATLFCCSTDGLLREYDLRNMMTISFFLACMVP